jgi:chemosensory pili system protein ChpA (sensor histidine kinase/response regulator)
VDVPPADVTRRPREEKSMTPFDEEILVGFFDEATEYLPAVRAGLAAFRRTPTAPDVLEEAHRLVHTIKGAAAMVGLAELSHAAYHLEDTLERLAHEPDAATPDLLDGIDRVVDDIATYLTEGRADGFRADRWAAATADRVAALAAGPVAWPTAAAVGGFPEPEVPPLDPSFDHLPLPNFETPESAIDPADSFPPARHDEETVTDELPVPTFGDETLTDFPFEVPPFAATESEPEPDSTPDVPTFDELPLPEFFPMAAADPTASETDRPAPDFDLPAMVDFGSADDAMPVPDFTASAVDPTPPGAEPRREDVSGDLLDIFRAEAEDHLRALTTLLPEARRDPADRDRWREVRRAAHTLKGSAAMVGFDTVTRLAHRMEDLLDAYYDGGRVATPDEIDLLVRATDAIADTVGGRADPAAFDAAHRGLEAALGGTVAEPASVGEPVADAEPEPVALPAAPAQPAAPSEPGASRKDTTEATVRVPITRLNDIVKLFGELVIARTAFEQQVDGFAKLLAEAVDTADRLKRVAGKIEAGFEAKALVGGAAGGADGEVGAAAGFDALEFDRYTEFHLLTRELAETATDIGTVFGEFGRLGGDFDGHLTRQRRLSSDIEDKLMRLRMVPLSGVEAKLARTVRQAAAAAGKAAELAFEGGRTGLDKTVLDAMADPLLHLLRNAVDHGLEAPDVRLALGKPAAGTITLTAAHEGSQVVLTIADDGRGVDYEAVRATAVRRGVVAPAAAAGLTPDDLARVLFEPGFSTRAEVSELSGRGVGLDVVKSKVEALKGTVALASVPGRGTTFTVRLPMTLAVARALLVKAAGQTFAIPLDAVEQLLRPDAADLDRVADHPVLRTGRDVLSVVPLAGLLGLPAAPGSTPDRPPVVLLNAGGRRVALQVDHLIGGREVVIKTLGKHLRRVPCVSGGTLMGDGSVILILNPADLTARGSGRVALRPAQATPVPEAAPASALTLLVVDDSPSVRRVLAGLGQRAGWDVHTAKDGLDALEILQRRSVRPDVVLTDVEMPRMDGYELLGTIRGQPAFAHLPVAMLTSRSGDKHRRKAMELGASAYVVKPYQDADLVAIVRQLAAAPAARPAAPQLVASR